MKYRVDLSTRMPRGGTRRGTFYVRAVHPDAALSTAESLLREQMMRSHSWQCHTITKEHQEIVGVD
jgi:hypothetical protein